MTNFLAPWIRISRGELELFEVRRCACSQYSQDLNAHLSDDFHRVPHDAPIQVAKFVPHNFSWLDVACGVRRPHPQLVHYWPRRGSDEPVALFTSEKDVFFPGEAVVARAREIVPNLVAAECLRGCRHIPTRAALGHVNEQILTFLKRHGDRIFT